MSQARDVRNGPWLGAVCEVGVRKHDDGCHVPYREPEGLDNGVEAVPGCVCGQHRNRALGVTTVEGGQQVGLLGFGGHTRGGAGALDVDHDERQLGHHGQSQRLLFEQEAGATGGTDAE